MSKMCRALLTSSHKRAPKGMFRPCVMLSGVPHQIEDDAETFEKARLALIAYSYGNPAFIYDDQGNMFSIDRVLIKPIGNNF